MNRHTDGYEFDFKDKIYYIPWWATPYSAWRRETGHRLVNRKLWNYPRTLIRRSVGILLFGRLSVEWHTVEVAPDAPFKVQRMWPWVF